MRFPDPLGLKTKPERFTIISTFVQDIGNRPRQEDFLSQEKGECFALADGDGTQPYGDVAAQLATEAVIWTYKLTKLKPYYWNDKKLLAGRMFRSANWRVFNKRRDKGFETGLATALLVLLISDQKFYIFNIGDSVAFLYRRGDIKRLTDPHWQVDGNPHSLLGEAHESPKPFWGAFALRSNDIIILATDGVVNYIQDDDLKKMLKTTHQSQEELTKIASLIIKKAAKRGSMDNRSICMVLCVAKKREALLFDV